MKLEESEKYSGEEGLCFGTIKSLKTQMKIVSSEKKVFGHNNIIMIIERV